tara:strand:+ start:294 stop:743 length:450 start_codon:yes stop_codon:yes gene_type:complete
VLNELKSKYPWEFSKVVIPQHADHAGVLWHGSYLNFLEEARIDALEKVGISYALLSQKGYEMPVISLDVKYKQAFTHGQIVHLKSQFKLLNKVRLCCKTLFLTEDGCIGAEATIELVVVSKKNNTIRIVRKLPNFFDKIFELLEVGPKN